MWSTFDFWCSLETDLSSSKQDDQDILRGSKAKVDIFSRVLRLVDANFLLRLPARKRGQIHEKAPRRACYLTWTRSCLDVMPFGTLLPPTMYLVHGYIAAGAPPVTLVSGAGIKQKIK